MNLLFFLSDRRKFEIFKIHRLYQFDIVAIKAIWMVADRFVIVLSSFGSFCDRFNCFHIVSKSFPGRFHIVFIAKRSLRHRFHIAIASFPKSEQFLKTMSDDHRR